MSTHKPTQQEEEFIAKQETETRRRIAMERARRMAQDEIERQKQLHYMKCPKCGMDLEEVLYRGVRLDKCFHCNGMWFDDGEVEALVGKGDGFLQSVLGIFKGRG
jgi:hypothetical protein